MRKPATLRTQLSLLALLFLLASGCGSHASAAADLGEPTIVTDAGADLAPGAVDLAQPDFAHAVDLAQLPDGFIPPTTAILTWTAPTMNTDGSPLDDLAGFNVYHGTVDPISTTNSTKVDVGDVLTYTFTGLAPGTHYFAVTAYTVGNIESAFSMEASKVVP